MLAMESVDEAFGLQNKSVMGCEGSVRELVMVEIEQLGHSIRCKAKRDYSNGLPKDKSGL